MHVTTTDRMMARMIIGFKNDWEVNFNDLSGCSRLFKVYFAYRELCRWPGEAGLLPLLGILQGYANSRAMWHKCFNESRKEHGCTQASVVT